MCESTLELQIHHVPLRRLWIGSWVKVWMSWLPCCVVRISVFTNTCECDNAGYFAAAMIKKNSVSCLHLVSQILACLIVPDAFPRTNFFFFKAVNTECYIYPLNKAWKRLGFDEPVTCHEELDGYTLWPPLVVCVLASKM